MAMRRVWRHSNEFKRLAVERFNNCENIVALAKELGIHRRLLYKWRKDFEVADSIGEPIPPNAREGKLRKELGHVKRLLAEKALEVDFFRGALQRVEARR
jgi:transposase-like protein